MSIRFGVSLPGPFSMSFGRSRCRHKPAPRTPTAAELAAKAARAAERKARKAQRSAEFDHNLQTASTPRFAFTAVLVLTAFFYVGMAASSGTVVALGFVAVATLWLKRFVLRNRAGSPDVS
jgi:cobalamin synthase